MASDESLRCPWILATKALSSPLALSLSPSAHDGLISSRSVWADASVVDGGASGVIAFSKSVSTLQVSSALSSLRPRDSEAAHLLMLDGMAAGRRSGSFCGEFQDIFVSVGGRVRGELCFNAVLPPFFFF